MTLFRPYYIKLLTFLGGAQGALKEWLRQQEGRGLQKRGDPRKQPCPPGRCQRTEGDYGDALFAHKTSATSLHAASPRCLLTPIICLRSVSILYRQTHRGAETVGARPSHAVGKTPRIRLGQPLACSRWAGRVLSALNLQRVIWSINNKRLHP